MQVILRRGRFGSRRVRQRAASRKQTLIVRRGIRRTKRNVPPNAYRNSLFFLLDKYTGGALRVQLLADGGRLS